MAKIRINGDTSGYIEISAPNVAGSTSITLPSTTGGNFLVTDSSGNLNVDSGTLYVDATNNRVGIGTSSPSRELHISKSGGSVFRAQDSSGTNQYIEIYNSGGNTYYDSNNNGNGTHLFRGSGGTEYARFDSSGRLGIGTTSPDNKLHIFAGDSSGSSHASAQLTIENSGNSALQFLAGTSSSSEIRFGDSGDNGAGSIAYVHSDNSLRFGTNNGTEKARIDSSGRLLIGTSTSVQTNDGFQPRLQVISDGSALSAISNGRYSADAFGSSFVFLKNRNTAVGSHTVLQNNDELGKIQWDGSDGSAFKQAAQIQAFVDGTPGANDMPGRLVFSTTADGASSPTERMRITSGGYLKASNTGSYLSGGTVHELQQSASTWSTYITNSNANPAGLLLKFSGASPNGTGSEFWYCEDSGSTQRASLMSNGGLRNYSANNSNLSDRNVKKDITLAAETWDCIKEWEIVNYRYKDQPDDADLNLGVIAQQVAESCPEVVTVFQEAREATEDQPAQEERLGVKEQQMYWMAIKALQEAQLRIEQLEATNASFEARLSALEVKP